MINALATVFCGIMCVANVAAGHAGRAAILGFLVGANAAVKARQAQLSQQRAKVLAKASELTPVPVDTRKAA